MGVGISAAPTRNVVALGGGHGLAVSLRALRRVTDHLTAIVGVADDGGSSGRLRREFGILPPGDLRMAVAALCADEPSARDWAEVLQFRFSGPGELGGHAVGNVLMAALGERTGDPVAGLAELGSLVGAVGRVLPCSLEPLEIHARIRGHDPVDPNAVVDVRGQVEIATTPGRVERVWLEPPNADPCAAALDAVGAADAIVLGPGSWFTSLMPHLVLPELGAAVASAPGRKIIVLNLDPQEGETWDFSPAEHIEALITHAPQLRCDVVLADERHVGAAQTRTELAKVCRQWGAQLVLSDVAGFGDRHDPHKLACAFDTVLA